MDTVLNKASPSCSGTSHFATRDNRPKRSVIASGIDSNYERVNAASEMHRPVCEKFDFRTPLQQTRNLQDEVEAISDPEMRGQEADPNLTCPIFRFCFGGYTLT